MEGVITLPNWVAVLFLFIGVAVGWMIGYKSGFMESVAFAIREAARQFPVRVVTYIEEKGTFVFDDVVTGKFIKTDTSVESFIEFAKVEFKEQKLVLIKGDRDEPV